MSADAGNDRIKIEVDPDSVTTSEPDEGNGPMPDTNQQPDAKTLPRYSEMAHPISGSVAHAYYRQLVGVASHRFFAREGSKWWDRLIAASTPEEKLTCERMIRAAHIASGLNQWETGKGLAGENRARSKRERDAMAEEVELARWR